MLEIQCSLWLGLAFECHLSLNANVPFEASLSIMMKNTSLGVGGFQFSLQSKTRSWFPFFGGENRISF